MEPHHGYLAPGKASLNLVPKQSRCSGASKTTSSFVPGPRSNTSFCFVECHLIVRRLRGGAREPWLLKPRGEARKPLGVLRRLIKTFFLPISRFSSNFWLTVICSLPIYFCPRNKASKDGTQKQVCLVTQGSPLPHRAAIGSH